MNLFFCSSLALLLQLVWPSHQKKLHQRYFDTAGNWTITGTVWGGTNTSVESWTFQHKSFAGHNHQHTLGLRCLTLSNIPVLPENHVRFSRALLPWGQYSARLFLQKIIRSFTPESGSQRKYCRVSHINGSKRHMRMNSVPEQKFQWESSIIPTSFVMWYKHHDWNHQFGKTSKTPAVWSVMWKSSWERILFPSSTPHPHVSFLWFTSSWLTLFSNSHLVCSLTSAATNWSSLSC